MAGNRYVTVCAGDTAHLHCLTRLGREIADESGLLLRILLLARAAGQRGERAALMEEVFECARQLDAEMSICFTDRPMEGLLKDASECLVMMRDTETAELVRRSIPEKTLMVME